jgi:serine/threonine protein kinase
MIVGEPPFFSDDVATLYRKILESKLEFPKGISEEAKNLLTNLLERNP